jgi:hypothetical protein
MPKVNNWEEWEDNLDHKLEKEKRNKIQHQNSKTDKQKTENRWREPQKLVYRKKKK